MRPRSLVLTSLALAACAHPPPVARPAANAPSPLRGVVVSDLDRTQAPCRDFFEYANGAWRAANAIPPSLSRWSRRWAAAEANKEQLKGILEEAAAAPGPRGTPGQVAGDFYAACLDEAAVEAAGVTPIAPLLADIDRAADRKDVERLIARLHDLDVPVPFSLRAIPDLHDPRRVIADVAASGLGLPDRNYYVKPDPRVGETRERYRAHVEKLLALAGFPADRARAATETVLDFETRLARASLDNVALRDPKNLDHTTTVPALQALAPHMDWSAYLDAVHVPRASLNVEQPAFLEEMDRLLEREPVARWRDYLAWHLVRSAAPQLSRALAQESFEFEEAYLAGATQQKPRWKRCVEQTDRLLGEAAGQKYVERYFPPAARARVQGMVGNLLLAMRDTIHGLAWMGPQTKERALRKLATFNPKIGYPDRWKDYSGVVIRRDAHWQNVAAARRFVVEDDRGTIGKPVDRGRWGMTPPTVDAYYNPLLNEIVFPAGILQPPAFDMGAVDAVNYGAIGVVIGHEISHGFDDEGSQFDADGRLSNWWTERDRQEFERRGQCVVSQFEGYFIEPGVHHDGKLVLGESIADLAGAKLAWLAFQKARQHEPAPSLDGFSPDQQFFIAWGQFRGDAVRLETQRLMVQSDPHPVAKFRVIGALSNLPEFAQAFACRPDDPMVRPPAQRCDVW